MDFPFLSVIVFLPFVAAIMLIFVKNESLSVLRGVSLAATLSVFFISIVLFIKFQAIENIQFVEQYNWISSLGISYLLGVDGINILLLLLTTFMGPIVILASWNSIKKHHKGFLIGLLLTQVGLSGTLVSLDLILFFVFLESTLLPLYFLIGIWGKKDRIIAANNFIVFNIAGSIFMIVAILILYFYHGGLTNIYTFNFLILSKIEIPPAYQVQLFFLFAFGFAIQIPIFPFHLWFKNVCQTAPIAVSVLLNTVFVKVGIYGFLRFCWPLLPSAAWQFKPLILGLGVVSIFYGALSAIIQKNLMRLIACIAFSQLGIILIGVFAINTLGVQGSLVQIVNHGLAVGALFLIVGILYERKPFAQIDSFSGLAKKMPVWTLFFAVICFSVIGVPGLSGFVGDFLILLGIFAQNEFVAVCVATSIILIAVYMLRVFRKLAFGTVLSESERIKDLSSREILVLAPIVILIFLIGVYPNLLLKKIEPSVKHLIEIVETRGIGYSTTANK